jgi:hypothetical protein
MECRDLILVTSEWKLYTADNFEEINAVFLATNNVVLHLFHLILNSKLGKYTIIKL